MLAAPLHLIHEFCCICHSRSSCEYLSQVCAPDFISALKMKELLPFWSVQRCVQLRRHTELEAAMRPQPHNAQLQMVLARQEAELGLPRHFGVVAVTQGWHCCATLSRGGARVGPQTLGSG